MKAFRFTVTYLLTVVLACLFQPLVVSSQTMRPQVNAPSADRVRDGQHDFDFSIGVWKSRIRRLQRPLTGSKEWIDVTATVTVSKVWQRRANLEETEADGPAGHLEGLTLRLYNPESRQWYLYWANSKGGTLGTPNVGEFRNGRGEFIDCEVLSGRAIFARNGFTDIIPNSSRFEQAFSDDGGKTWEINWFMTFTRDRG